MSNTAGASGHVLPSPRHASLNALQMMSPALARNKGLFAGLQVHAQSMLQSPGLSAMKALVHGIDKVDRALAASFNSEESMGVGAASLTKVYFRVNHPPSRPKVDDVEVKMHLLGSLKPLGSWDEQRAKTMKRSSDGGWESVCYLATNETFEYQYILKDFDGKSVWRSSAERQQTIDDIGGTNMLEVIDFITKGEEETGNLYNQAAARALPPTPGGDEDAKLHDVEVEISDCPVGVDVGRDSICALPRDSLLPAPTSENTRAMLRKSTAPSLRGSASGFEDCQEWLTAPPGSPSKRLCSPVQRAQKMEGEDVHEEATKEDGGGDSSAATEEGAFGSYLMANDAKEQKGADDGAEEAEQEEHGTNEDTAGAEAAQQWAAEQVCVHMFVCMCVLMCTWVCVYIYCRGGEK